MARTIEMALRSILEQVDPNNYEIVLVDDGSKDNSVQIVKKLQQEFTNLRLICLERDPGRKVGLTMNASVQQARGKYALLHLDCDDITAPHIQDFVTIFHKIEKGINKNFLLQGHPIKMAKRDFLLSIGPYQNIYRGQDRDLRNRLIAKNALIVLAHKSLKTVLPDALPNRIKRIFYYNFNLIENEFRYYKKQSLGSYIWSQFKSKSRLKTIILRTVLATPAWLKSKVKSDVLVPNAILMSSKEIENYEKKHKGTYEEIMKKMNQPVTWGDLSPNSKEIFSSCSS